MDIPVHGGLDSNDRNVVAPYTGRHGHPPHISLEMMT